MEKMELRFSVLARNREFAQAMRRIRPRFSPLVDVFATTELINPIHEAILVGITDDKGPNFFEEVPNRDGFFQVLAGVDLKQSDEMLVKNVFDTLRRAAIACPFSKPDHGTIQRVFDESEPKVTRKQG
jgi:hypothetical protein